MAAFVLGTAGHIDHGKSALVQALTGTDPDRLKEEKARGITIDLGFAHARIGDADVAFVDVPGHERFVRNMLAGAGGIDAVLIVVAATESVMPQTREHVAICRLLGIERAVVALTKCDLADEETQAIAAIDVRDLLAGGPFAGAPIVPVSARTGTGLDALRAAIAALAPTTAARQAREGLVRLPIDRVFTVKGFGTVVTGTLVSGRVAAGESLVALPAGDVVRVRGVQVHGRMAEAATAPRRVALNLGAVATTDLARGTTLASAGSVAVTRRVDLRLSLLGDARPLRHGGRVRLHHGTSEVLGRVSIAATRARPDAPWTPARAGDAGVVVPPGGEAYARVRLERAAVLTRGDRVVLRAYSPLATIGGGLVLDPEAPAGGVRRAATFERCVTLDAAGGDALVWIADGGLRGLDAGAFVSRAGLTPAAADAATRALADAGRAVVAGGRWFAAEHSERIAAAIVERLEAHHAAAPRDPGPSRGALRELAAPRAPEALFDLVLAGLLARGVVQGPERLALAGRQAGASAGDAAGRQRIEDAARVAGLSALEGPALAAVAGDAGLDAERLLRELIKEGRLVRVGPFVFDAAALTGLAADVRGLGAGAPAGTRATIDVGTFKARYGLTRKHAIPLLEWLDRERVTRRVGNAREVI
ncbi:MAG: selenocysteine-specific translation elongation factor [Vicinamibacterales bacterium]